jgi:hypothetical protein
MSSATPTSTTTPARLNAAAIIHGAHQNESEVPVSIARYWLTLIERPAQKRRSDEPTAIRIAAALRARLTAHAFVELRYQAIDFLVHPATRERRDDATTFYTIEIVRPARSPAHAEQREITALVAARVDALRAARGWSIERLAGASNLSIWTLISLRRHLADPRLSTLLSLGNGLGVTSSDLLGDLPLPIEPRPCKARPGPAAAGARA